jgi:hypothetical protein
MRTILRKCATRTFLFTVVTMASLICCNRLHAVSASQDIKQSQYDAGEDNKASVLKYLMPVLTQAGKVGRIYFAADCPPDEAYPYVPYPFPTISVKPPAEGASGVAAVQEMFREDKNVTIEEKPEGIVRVRIGGPNEELLQTRIANITFNSEEQYNSEWAIRAIKSTKEVAATIHNLGITGDSRPVTWLETAPDERLPHLPDSIKNVTMDEALDRVAQTFGGMVVYGTCVKQHYITIKFTGGRGYLNLRHPIIVVKPRETGASDN